MAQETTRTTGDPEVLEYLGKHPGGFDIDFFERFLPRTVIEYATHRGGLDPTTMEVVVTTELCESFPIAGARVALTRVLFFTEDDKMVFLPHHHVAAVVVRRREGAPPKNPVGFTVEAAGSA